VTQGKNGIKPCNFGSFEFWTLRRFRTESVVGE